MRTYETSESWADTPSKVRTYLVKDHPLSAFTHRHITDRKWGTHRVANVMPWKVMPYLWAWNRQRVHGKQDMPCEIQALVMFSDLTERGTWLLRPELSALITVPLSHPTNPRSTYKYGWSEITNLNNLVSKVGVPKRNSAHEVSEPLPETLRKNLSEVLREVLEEFNLLAVPERERQVLLHEVHVALTS